MKTETLAETIQALVRLYQGLLDEETHCVELYLAGDLDGVEASRTRSERHVAEIRNWLAGLGTLPQAGGPLERSGRTVLREAVQELRRTVAELQTLLKRNRRFVQNSLGYTDRMLEAMFGGSSSYDGAAMLHRAENHAAPVRGVRA
jgi:hypothetical protein